MGYVAMLSVVFGILLFMGSGKENMLLNVDRDSQAYDIRKSGAVHNIYTFLVQNTDSRAHSFGFEIMGDENLYILEPSSAVRVDAGQKRKVVAIIRTNSPESKALQDREFREDIVIKSYALDDEKINVTRKSFFMYPSLNEIRAVHAK